jgi:capsule polysaccharide export protein KpsE/RkpR
MITRITGFNYARKTQSFSSNSKTKEERLEKLNSELKKVNAKLEDLERINETKSPEYNNLLNEMKALHKQIAAVSAGF